MPVFLCRWPNGDCSIVLASNEAKAIERLDEVANAEGCPIKPLGNLQVHFALTEEGRLALEGLGEATEAEIFEFCYPELVRTAAVSGDVASAVNRERERVQIDEASATTPATDVGKRAKQQLDMPTTLIDRIVTSSAKLRLKSFKPPGSPS